MQLYADGWDYSASSIRYAYNYWDGSATQWTEDPAEMTNTGNTYHTYPVYSGYVQSEGNDVKVFFYHFKNNELVEGSAYQASSGDDWVNIWDHNGKMYNGWHNDQHEWIENPTFDTEETFTIYYVCENANGYTIKANMRVSDEYNTWKTYSMTNTGKTHDGVDIYSADVTIYRGGVLNLQLQRWDGESFIDQVVPVDGSQWTLKDVFAGKMFVAGSGWIDYSDDGGATALDEATDSKKAVKRIVDGQLVIIKNGVKYNALGAEVK